MQAIRDAIASTELPRGVIATIGNYDGIHIGQQSVLDMVTGRARRTRGRLPRSSRSIPIR